MLTISDVQTNRGDSRMAAIDSLGNEAFPDRSKEITPSAGVFQHFCLTHSHGFITLRDSVSSSVK